jgi:hypothetical protein
LQIKVKASAKTKMTFIPTIFCFTSSYSFQLFDRNRTENFGSQESLEKTWPDRMPNSDEMMRQRVSDAAEVALPNRIHL